MLILSRFLFWFLLCLLASDIGNPWYLSSAELTSANSGRHKEFLKRTLLAVEKVVSFFASEYRNFNIDGVFGLQALDGKLHVYNSFISTKTDMKDKFKISQKHECYLYLCVYAARRIRFTPQL